MESQNCDIWLLTEVPRGFAMEPGNATFSQAMAGVADKAFAAVWAREGVDDLPEVHATAAFAMVGDLRVCSCVLPWRAAESQGWPVEGDLVTITGEAIECARNGLANGRGDLVWGGDWNLALEGHDDVGTPAGRSAVLGLVETLRLTVPTTGEDHTRGNGHGASITLRSRVIGRGGRYTSGRRERTRTAERPRRIRRRDSAVLA